MSKGARRDYLPEVSLLSREQIVFIKIRWRIDCWNRELLFRPSAKIDLFATFAAEGAEFIGFHPLDLFTASGASYNGNHKMNSLKIAKR